MTYIDDFRQKHEGNMVKENAMAQLKDPTTRANGRETLINLVNAATGNRAPIDPINSPEHVIERGYGVADKFYTAEAINYTRGHIDEIIGDIEDSKLVAKLSDVAPLEIDGEDVHNSIVKTHGKYRIVKDLYDIAKGDKNKAKASGINEEDAKKNLISNVTPDYAKVKANDLEVDWKANTSLDDSQIKIGSDFVEYVTLVQGVHSKDYDDVMKNYVSGFVADRENEFTSKFANDSEKVKYVGANLKALVDKDINNGMAQIYGVSA
jgi:hypothetical protein